jgi:uncharacterized protein (TIGR02996 family)
MSDERALLAAIWEHPHEDTPRLMYADWLEENGQPERGEFIRVQCELAQLDEWDEEKRPTLEKREKKLWKRFEKAWRAKLRGALRGAPFHRGFIAPKERRASAERFCALEASDFAAAPTWDYTIDGPTAGLAELARCANLRRLTRLKFWLSVTPEEAAEMMSSSHLRTVRALGLGYGLNWGRNLAALAANPATESLAELDVNEGFDDAVAAALASTPAFAKLRTLSTYRHTLTAAGVGALFNSPHLAGLTELVLPGWYAEEGARAIAESRPHFRLRKLVMYGAPMTDAGVALVADWPGLESVRSLNIGGRCEVIGPRALARSPHARNLRELDLGLSNLSREGALALARSETLDLKRLVIRMTPAADDDRAVAALVKRFGTDAVKVRYPGQRKRR